MKILNKNFIRYLKTLNDKEITKIKKLCNNEELKAIEHALSTRVLDVDEIFTVLNIADDTILTKVALMLNANKFIYDNMLKCFILDDGTTEFKFNLKHFNGANTYIFKEDMEEYTGVKYYYANFDLSKVIKRILPDGTAFSPEAYANLIGVKYNGKSLLTMTELDNPNLKRFEISLASDIPILNNQEERIDVSKIYKFNSTKNYSLSNLSYNIANNVFEIDIESFYEGDHLTALNNAVAFLKEEFVKSTFHNVKEVSGKNITAYPVFNGSLHEIYQKKLDGQLIIKRIDLFDLISFYSLSDGKINIYTSQKFYKKNDTLNLVHATVVDVTTK